MADDGSPDPDALECREPTLEDLRDLCRELNQCGARYIVIGGFALRVRAALPRAIASERRHGLQEAGSGRPTDQSAHLLIEPDCVVWVPEILAAGFPKVWRLHQRRWPSTADSP